MEECGGMQRPGRNQPTAFKVIYLISAALELNSGPWELGPTVGDLLRQPCAFESNNALFLYMPLSV